MFQCKFVKTEYEDLNMSGSYMSLHCDRRKQLNLIFDPKKINKTKKSATASNKTTATTERKRVCDFSSFFDLNHNPPPTPVEKGWRITYHSSFCRHQKQKATNGRVCVSDSGENCQCFKNKTTTTTHLSATVSYPIQS